HRISSRKHIFIAGACAIKRLGSMAPVPRAMPPDSRIPTAETVCLRNESRPGGNGIRSDGGISGPGTVTPNAAAIAAVASGILSIAMRRRASPRRRPIAVLTTPPLRSVRTFQEASTLAPIGSSAHDLYQLGPSRSAQIVPLSVLTVKIAQE